MIDETSQQQKKLDSFPADPVKQWNGLRKDDYDFRSWTKGASRERLEAGCVYEYTRENTELRASLLGLIVLRPIYIEANLPRSFRKEIERLMLGSLPWLADFAEELADNKSFAELFRTNRAKLERSFVERPLHFPLKAVQLFLPRSGAEEMPWPWRPRGGSAVGQMPKRHVRKDGSEDIAIQIRWGDFTNDEIGKAMKEFARAYRPRDETAKEPRRQGKRPKITIQSYLNALSVMRIWKHEHNQRKRLNLVAEVCGYNGCEKEAAAYKDRCKDGHADQPMNKAAKVEMTKARKRALSLFRHWFPRDNPANY
jgi:hypothetical protein